MDTAAILQAARRQASSNIILGAAPTTPTEEDLEQMEAEEMLAGAAVEKAKQRLSLKHQHHEELKLRMAHGRKKRDTKQAKAKSERLEAIMNLRREEMRHQKSEQE